MSQTGILMVEFANQLRDQGPVGAGGIRNAEISASARSS